MTRHRLERISARPLEIPLSAPFVIASARVDVTPNVLVEVEVVDTQTGARAVGLGEAATLHPVTEQTQADVLALINAKNVDVARLHGSAAQGALTAFEDAVARLEGRTLRDALAEGRPVVHELVSDITLSIGEPQSIAVTWRQRGFTCFKVKVGKNVDADLQALERIHQLVPDATFILDANAAYTATEAIFVARACARLGLTVDCFEQPCGKDALDAMAEVCAALDVPVIADESFQGFDDLARLAKAKAADGVNLKLAKLGSPREAVRIGRAARELYGMKLMMGAMVESRLSISAAANVAAALGGVDFCDVDTAFLLAADPFTGGYVATGPRLALTAGAGLDCEVKR